MWSHAISYVAAGDGYPSPSQTRAVPKRAIGSPSYARIGRHS